LFYFRCLSGFSWYKAHPTQFVTGSYQHETWFLYDYGGAVFSSLADNALLIAAIKLLESMESPG
jgi:hypothetical protein